MDDLRMPEKNTATRNGFEVFLKAIGGFIFGLIVTIFAVPGVKEAALQYFSDNWPQLLLTLGTSTAFGTGGINFIFDYFKKGVKNY